MNNNGFTNETEFSEYLNNKNISDLNANLKRFILEIFSLDTNTNALIKCEKIGGRNKGDIVISINSVQKTISLKIGSGNSVHQEPVESFISFLKNQFDLDDETSNCIRLFIWGDKTLDGTGLGPDRIDARKFKKENPEITERIQNYFNEHKRELIKRFAIEGVNCQSTIDYIYHGDIESGHWISSEALIEWALDEQNESHGAISVGALTFQAWNRNINGGFVSEKKRGVIQLKWGSLEDDLIKLYE
jgi:hypothetical protein